MSVLLINLCRDSELREKLLEILDASRDEELLCEAIDHSSVDSESALSAKVRAATADVILLLHSSDQLQVLPKLIKETKASKPNAEIILVTEGCGSEEILDLLRVGASDYILPPLIPAATLPRIRRFVEKARLRRDPIQVLKKKFGVELLVGQAPSFRTETGKIPLLASCDGRVLILGETGTGKELFARAIHYLSPRMEYPFTAVSGGSIPVELLESELFGHRRGAFTGALQANPGLVNEAEGGTLFLDEVDCFPLASQTKLLRFLQEGEYRPLGSTKSCHADVRVIAASNVNLRQAVSEGKMREDLYYRLSVIQISLPPLRDRREDIPLLANHFLRKYANEFNRNVCELSHAAIQTLVLYDWPGNVRELENAIERAVLLASGDCVLETDILLPQSNPRGDDESFNALKAKTIAHFERTYIHGLMATYHGNVSQAARAAKKNRRAFWELIRKHHIDVGTFRTNIAPARNPVH